jgi:hypothetical protein
MLVSVLMFAVILGVAFGAYKVLFKKESVTKAPPAPTNIIPPAPTRTPRKKKATDAEE